MVPTASHFLVVPSANDTLRQSRGTSVVMLFSYGLWLFFQLHTHRTRLSNPSRPKAEKWRLDGGTIRKMVGAVGAKDAGTIGGALTRSQLADAEEPSLGVWTAIGTIIVSTVLIAFKTQFATDSINGLLAEANLSSAFVGLVTSLC